MTDYHCHQCKAPGHFMCPASVEPRIERCQKCGATHVRAGSQVSPLSPPMLPIVVAGRASPWMLGHTRPHLPGVYDCRFRGLGQVLRLYWNGRYFQPSNCDNRVVLLATFETWRGTWGESW